MTEYNYPPKFWQWLIGLTQTWEIESDLKRIRSKLSGNKYSIDDFHSNSEQLQSIIYQAIDGWNKNHAETITQDYYCRGIFLKGFEKCFYWTDYPSPTIARLEALKWIWEQENE